MKIGNSLPAKMCPTTELKTFKRFLPGMILTASVISAEVRILCKLRLTPKSVWTNTLNFLDLNSTLLFWFLAIYTFFGHLQFYTFYFHISFLLVAHVNFCNMLSANSLRLMFSL